MAVDPSHSDAPPPDVCRLYTAANLAELLGAPASAIRRWHRQGVLVAVRSVRRLPYFDFQEVAVARKLASLLGGGCTLRMIDRRLRRLSSVLPDVERPLADPRVVVEGRRLYLRYGDDLAEPGGQLLLDFDASPDAIDDDRPNVLALTPLAASAASSCDQNSAADAVLEDLRLTALDCEDAGELQQAADAYRALLAAGGAAAETNFALADVLYRQGDLAGARERFYVTIELDEEFVEARFNLGCVLAELGDLELARASFDGTLAFHPDYADAHFHLAGVLDRLQQTDEAACHYASFLSLSPESPWAATARDRLAELPTASMRV